ncbi:MAG: CooT family nickel-binding protein [Promethearchaeota archaeon]|nr:MAG: CooT family nickel-binding protein [Candidatus Lokiarchaeota archaeon]
MCEFKIIRKNDGSQIMEDIVVVNYTDDHSLVLKDVLGMGEVLDSALILDVNTINQTLVVIEHPLIKQFLSLIKKLTDDHANNEEIDSLIEKLNEIKT